MVAPAAAPKTIGEVGAGKFWFDTTGFSTHAGVHAAREPLAVRRSEGAVLQERGPRAFEARSAERDVGLNFRIEAYNLLNAMNWANPNTTIGASDFGQVLRQADAYFGRQLQYTMRVEF